MMKINLPYGKEFLECELPEDRVLTVLESGLHTYIPEDGEEELVKKALEHPICTPKLEELAAGKEKVVIITSDHTRPVPSKRIMPHILEEVRRGNPLADITILVATGCHRETRKSELIGKLGSEIVEKEKIVIHDCDQSEMADLGVLPSGGPLILNRLAAEADLLIAEGFIEPHFFAGYSGGRKSVLPGVAAREVVLANHNGRFIDDPHARTGNLDGNPIHADMVYASRRAGVDFIVNVVLDQDKKIVYAAAGDVERAHLAGCAFLEKYCRVVSEESDIVITTNGGYPLDQNIYQAVKGMTTGEALVKKGGVIIMAAKAEDGHGGEAFYRTFRDEKNLEKMIRGFIDTPPEKTIVDQWQSQILARVLCRAHVIFISDQEDAMVENFQMIPAKTVEEALRKADELLGNTDSKITVVPDGVGVVAFRK